jgi:hypothetical protein
MEIKRIHIVFWFLSIVCLTHGISQNIPGNTSIERMRRDVSFLASDSLEGREAGTKGEQIASAYISEKMAEIGLLPKGNTSASYNSSFRMSYPVIFKDVKLNVNSIEFEYPEDIGATDFSAAGSVTAPVVFLSKGHNGSESQLLHEIENDDINGKIVIVDIASKLKTNENDIIINEIYKKLKTLEQKGAKGLILHNSNNNPTENYLFGSPFTESLSIPVVYIARLPFNKIRKLKKATCSLSVEMDRTISNPSNVIGWVDNKSEKTVVIGAHYDHVGLTKSRTGNDKSIQIHNGADDNASGTAAMLELARWVTNNESLRYNYIFVAFSAEEKGLFGSKAFCSRDWVNNKNIVYMLNMDMVGRLGCEGDTIQVLGVSSSPVWDVILDSIDHPDFSIKKIYGAPAFSDHAPFLKKGIPVIYFTTGIHPDYHTPNDDTEFINFAGMNELQAYLRQFLRTTEAFPEVPFHKIHALQQTKAYIQVFK